LIFTPKYKENLNFEGELGYYGYQKRSYHTTIVIVIIIIIRLLLIGIDVVLQEQNLIQQITPIQL